MLERTDGIFIRQELLARVRRALLWMVVVGLGLFALFGVIASRQFTGGGAPFFLAAAVFAAPPVHVFWKRYFAPSRGLVITCILMLILIGLFPFSFAIDGHLNAFEEQRNKSARDEGWQSDYDKKRAVSYGFPSPVTWAPYRATLDEQAAADRAAREERARAAQAAAEEANRQKEAECRVTLGCWAEKTLVAASIQCREPVERLARFSFKWLDKWYEPKFSHYRWAAKEKGIVTYLGDRLEVQNVFGAWQPHIYECDFDPAGKQVIAVRGYPGRF